MRPRYTRPAFDRSVSTATTESDRTIEKNSEKQSQKSPGKKTEKPETTPVEFRLNLPGAKSATVAGTFNGWDINRSPLAKDPSGGWKTTILLKPGRYEYRFVIDGAQWYSDPGAKECVSNEFGSTNSVVVV